MGGGANRVWHDNSPAQEIPHNTIFAYSQLFHHHRESWQNPALPGRPHHRRPLLPEGAGNCGVADRVDANPRRMLARSLLLSPIGGRTKLDLTARGNSTHSGAPGHARCGR
ncbi:hypothetical protein BDA96_10G104000 [Sorghum bicolor]|uniref:Uncharacterized protein n=1 Tax=Sorghum bicolor TaxID=4558 RepID=A0A921Q2A5_SORBI|nr:hypothetical protein BDA96_10G104000 [Sorghum bicolor]